MPQESRIRSAAVVRIVNVSVPLGCRTEHARLKLLFRPLKCEEWICRSLSCITYALVEVVPLDLLGLCALTFCMYTLLSFVSIRNRCLFTACSVSRDYYAIMTRKFSVLSCCCHEHPASTAKLHNELTFNAFFFFTVRNTKVV